MIRNIALFATSTCFPSIDEMSLEEKVGQLFMVHVQAKEENSDAKTLIQDAHIGGIIYYTWANGLESPEQVRNLSQDLQALAKIPLLIAADQEGGVVARLQTGFTEFPGNKALGVIGDLDLIEQTAYAMGQELLSVGINMNLAPVVDVNCEEKNPVIGLRSYGRLPELVTACGAAALQGFENGGVIATLKHFPGHGRTKLDSHEALPAIDVSLEELEKTELFPFATLSKLAPAIMTAHVLVPTLDPEFPATLSKKTLSLLREKLNFQGVIISDSLVMQGILQKYSVDEAAILAFNAGCDLIMLGGKQLIGEKETVELSATDIERVLQNFIKAVREGKIKEENINSSVERILHLKQTIRSAPSLQLHNALAEDIAKRALKIVQNHPIENLATKKICVVAPEILRNNLKTLDQAILDPKDLAINEAEVLIIFSYNAWKNPEQEAWISALCKLGKPVILIATRDPLDAELFAQAHIVLTTFSPTSVSLQAAWNLLKKLP